MRADKPGSEQDITSREIQEDCTLFGGEFVEGGVSISRRRKVVGNRAKYEEYTYNTETVYTFEVNTNPRRISSVTWHLFTGSNLINPPMPLF